MGFDQRKRLSHRVPSWVPDTPVFFITINCSPRGVNQLADSGVFGSIVGALETYKSQSKCFTHLLLVMPDHLHVLLSVNLQRCTLGQLIGSTKRYLANHRNIKWQKNFFDHRIRSDGEFEEKAHYVLMNPVRAGLVDAVEEWPYWSRV
ncbi:MAG: REP-associated tyrosine transposase [Opitutales bacterium]